MKNHFSRAELAFEMAHQLIHLGVMNESLRSGLFISGQRRTGKTTFLLMDFHPGPGARVGARDLRRLVDRY